MRQWLGILVLAGILSSCGEAEPEEKWIRPVRVAEAKALSREISERFPGLAAPTQEVNLSFRVSGPLVEFPVRTGMSVQEGQVLAQVDSADFSLQKAAVEGRLAGAEAALSRSRSDYERQKRIQEQDAGATSQRSVERALQVFQNDLASVHSLKAEFGVAENNLSYTSLTAPFSGRVVATYVENHQVVQAQEPILRLLDTSRIEMTIHVPESGMARLNAVRSIGVHFDVLPGQVFAAEIKELGTEASELTRTYPVTLILDPPEDGTILPGMAGYADVVTESDTIDDGMVEVPSSAVASDRYGRSYVFVLDEHTEEVRRRTVELGELRNEGVVVRRGLKAGERVVTAGLHFLEDGQEVKAER